MPIGSAFHARTLPLAGSLSFRDWAGYYAVSAFEAHHEHEYNAIRNGCGLIDISPLFPTPAGALNGLAALAPLPVDRASIVDAGCGVGDGLRELHREYPAARIDGLEWSWPLTLVCAWRCRFARVRRADIWTADWSGYGMVYLFQRPESMPRAVAKATRELGAGAWMASLEFEATTLEPQHVLRCPDGRPVWLYRAPFTIRAADATRDSTLPIR